MAQVNIVRHNPIAIFSNPTEVIITDDNGHVVRLVEPSGNVGTQYANDVGSEWFGTIENLNKGLEICGVHWSDVYKTDVLWTTPSADRDECDQRKNDFNACYGAMIAAVTSGPLRSNRMARFTHPEGFPDPAALFEVQIKACAGETVSISSGKIDYGTWVDHQPSGASVMHQRDGEMITTLGDDLAEEMRFILDEQYAKPFAEQGVDFKKQTVFMEILVAVDDDPAKTWQRIETTRQVFAEYYGDDCPAGLIYPVSRIPNLDSIIEPQPRVVSGEVEIVRSGQIEDGFSTWAGLRHHGVREVHVSAVGGQRRRPAARHARRPDQGSRGRGSQRERRLQQRLHRRRCRLRAKSRWLGHLQRVLQRVLRRHRPGWPHRPVYRRHPAARSSERHLHPCDLRRVSP